MPADVNEQDQIAALAAALAEIGKRLKDTEERVTALEEKYKGALEAFVGVLDQALADVNVYRDAYRYLHAQKLAATPPANQEK